MRINSLNGQTFKAQGDLNNISREDVRERLKELNSDAPIFFTTSFIKQPQEITIRAVTRNNIMLEQVLKNQEQILENQNRILKSNLDVKA